MCVVPVSSQELAGSIDRRSGLDTRSSSAEWRERRLPSRLT